ncbi:MAG: M20/M25/M40 family metallo-hydrolase [Gemmatimonadaceae bacterium]
MSKSQYMPRPSRLRLMLAAGLATMGALFGMPADVTGQEVAPPAERELARSILKELIEINTTQSVGSTRKAAEAMAERVRSAGYDARDISIVGPEGERKSLIVRLRGKSDGPARKALLLMAHTDVVEAKRDDWSSDPFVFRADSASFYGRGTIDNKSGAAMLVANMMRWKREGFVPDRDVIMLLTTDEETDAIAGIQYVLKNHRDLVDAEFCLNTDGGGVELKDGKPNLNVVGAAEKVYQSFTLEVRNRGGHSSVPRKDNAIYQLSKALVKLSEYAFPVQLNDVTRTMFERSGKVEKGQLGADMRAVATSNGKALGAVHRLAMSPTYNSLLRTTCVATMLDGGHADNALPQLARATVNCRMFPGSKVEEVRQALAKATGDTAVVVKPIAPFAIESPASPIRADLLGILDRLTARYYAGATVVPAMETGASDGLFLRNAGIPTYNTGAIAGDPDDDRAHGRDERVLEKSFYDATQFWYDLVKSITTPGVTTKS